MLQNHSLEGVIQSFAALASEEWFLGREMEWFEEKDTIERFFREQVTRS